MQKLLTYVGVAILAHVAAAAVHAAPPKVVKAAPDNGDVDVDPGLREIRITFDQAMDPDGRSIVGGGDGFPQILGAPRFINARTIVIRVKLKPNHNYWLSINNAQFRNFTNRAGESAEPYPIQFRTGAGKKGAGDELADDVPADNSKSNRRAFNRLQSAVRNHYSYRDRLGIDWDKLFDSHRNALVNANTPQEFAKIAGMLLSRAKDKHIWFRVGDDTIPSYMQPQVPNANYKLLPKLVPNLKKHGRAAVSGRWDDDRIGYIAIAAWDRQKLDDGGLIFDAVNELQGTKALIIDVRLNGGGDETLARDFAGCFLDERKLYAKNVYRDPKSPTGFTEPLERWVAPNETRERYMGRVAVLSGPVVMSSCESFLLMMKTVPDAVIVGASSQGSSGNPKPRDLGNGVTVFLPSWKDMTPAGKELEGVGVPPDIEVKATPADFASGDPVLEAALEHLRGTSQ